MNFRIANRVSLAIGLLLFLFFMTSFVSFLLTKRIEDDVVRWVQVDEPRQFAAFTMDSQIAEATRSALAYSMTGSADQQARVLAALGKFEESVATLIALSESPEQRSLGEAAMESSARLRVAVDELISLTDREANLSGELFGTLGTMSSLSSPGADAGDASEAMAALQSHVDGLSAAIAGFRATGRQGERENAQVQLSRVGEMLRGSALSAGAALTPDRRAALAANFGRTRELLATLITQVEQKRALSQSIEQTREHIQTLLASGVIPKVRSDRNRAQESVTSSTFTAVLYILVMTAFGVLLGAGAAVVLTRGIVRPLLTLTEGAEAIGSGILNHRIDIRSEDEIGQLAASFNRMAENRQKTEEALRELAHHDTLTALPNRGYFQLRLREALENGHRNNRMVAVHLLDLDHFKDINDTLGHPAGDELLKQVAERLRLCVRQSDTVARLGGDEFAIIQTNLDDARGVILMTSRVIESISEPFEIEGEEIYSGTSIGVTVFPEDDRDAEQLLKNADLALYRAKQAGRNTFQLYDSSMNEAVLQRRELERDLRFALENEDFVLHYQPQIDVKTGYIVGAEALVRWQHNERGLVSPAEFIEVAEQSGMITKITDQILLEACSQARRWRESGLPSIRISVNLSPVDIRRRDLVDCIKSILDETGMKADCLEIEITEGTAMSDVESVMNTLNRLHTLGVELAIDDFGTGYSSMMYLKQFPFDRLKIDQAFVRGLNTNSEDAGIATAIIRLGHSLDLKVIAEGVEQEDQLEFLREAGCDEFQGYLISRPLEADDFLEFARSKLTGPSDVIAGVGAS
jgi:diguanylate cyclase (GGDEF)-like protein